MTKVLFRSFSIGTLLIGMACHCYNARASYRFQIKSNINNIAVIDTVPPADIMEVVKAAIGALNGFKIEAVAELYTPNALIADDEAPFSWNGPTAGVQWINAVQDICKTYKLTKLTATIQPINVYQLNADNAYVIVPVDYSGLLHGNAKFTEKGAFTFVLREVNKKWLIKTQVWMPENGLKN